MCYSHTASAGRARAAHCVVGRFGPPERCRKGHAPSAGGLPANFLNIEHPGRVVHAAAVPVRAVAPTPHGVGTGWWSAWARALYGTVRVGQTARPRNARHKHA